MAEGIVLILEAGAMVLRDESRAEIDLQNSCTQFKPDPYPNIPRLPLKSWRSVQNFLRPSRENGIQSGVRSRCIKLSAPLIRHGRRMDSGTGNGQESCGKHAKQIGVAHVRILE
ncbi:hypothetical protein D3C81_1578070 [compost metagenome]